jgi:hypothetical protein
MKYFKSIDMQKESHSFDHYFAFVLIIDNTKINKIIIDFRDKNTVKDEAYQWCDIYAKVNFNKEFTQDKYFAKIISIPPGFGIRVYNLMETISYALCNLMKSLFYMPIDMKSFVLNYAITYYSRSPIESYNVPIKSRDNYIFFISTLWNHDNCVTSTNKLRYIFISKARTLKNIIFEGGFKASMNNPEYEKYKDVIFTKRYSVADYVKKTKQSCCVFNTPSVHYCHGWKLGEFLAMGKAIISSTFFNDLPQNLQHGDNIHIVKNEQEIGDALSLICNDAIYRSNLECKAKEYYNLYSSPQAVINTILLRINKK